MIAARIPAGEDDSVGKKLGEWNNSAGRKSTLTILLGSNTLWGERCFAELLIITCWRYLCCMLEVLIDFAGDKKTVLTTTFPWLLAEDNPVIS